MVARSLFSPSPILSVLLILLVVSVLFVALQQENKNKSVLLPELAPDHRPELDFLIVSTRITAPQHAAMFSISLKNHRAYCHLHGYTYAALTRNLVHGFAPSFNGVYILGFFMGLWDARGDWYGNPVGFQEAAASFDMYPPGGGPLSYTAWLQRYYNGQAPRFRWLMKMDADALFTRLESPLNTLVPPAEHKQLVITGYGEVFNCGVFLIRSQGNFSTRYIRHALTILSNPAFLWDQMQLIAALYGPELVPFGTRNVSQLAVFYGGSRFCNFVHPNRLCIARIFAGEASFVREIHGIPEHIWRHVQFLPHRMLSSLAGHTMDWYESYPFMAEVWMGRSWAPGDRICHFAGLNNEKRAEALHAVAKAVEGLYPRVFSGVISRSTPGHLPDGQWQCDLSPTCDRDGLSTTALATSFPLQGDESMSALVLAAQKYHAGARDSSISFDEERPFLGGRFFDPLQNCLRVSPPVSHLEDFAVTPLPLDWPGLEVNISVNVGVRDSTVKGAVSVLVATGQCDVVPPFIDSSKVVVRQSSTSLPMFEYLDFQGSGAASPHTTQSLELISPLSVLLKTVTSRLGNLPTQKVVVVSLHESALPWICLAAITLGRESTLVSVAGPTLLAVSSTICALQPVYWSRMAIHRDETAQLGESVQGHARDALRAVLKSTIAGVLMVDAFPKSVLDVDVELNVEDLHNILSFWVEFFTASTVRSLLMRISPIRFCSNDSARGCLRTASDSLLFQALKIFSGSIQIFIVWSPGDGNWSNTHRWPPLSVSRVDSAHCLALAMLGCATECGGTISRGPRWLYAIPVGFPPPSNLQGVLLSRTA